MSRKKTPQEKLADYIVDPGTGCHLWRPENANGTLTVDRVSKQASRWAFEFFVGPILEGFYIKTTCGNQCVNPAHLEQYDPSISVLNPVDQLNRYVVDPATGCHNWTGLLTKDGYGYIRKQNNGKKVVYLVHRLAFEHYIGQVPAGLFVRHMCDNPRCFNPRHLGIGNHQDNAQDCIGAGRFKFPPRRGGENHYNCQVSDADVAVIRSLLATGYSTGKVAKMLDLKPTYVWKVGTNRIRKVANG